MRRRRDDGGGVRVGLWRERAVEARKTSRVQTDRRREERKTG